jgi:multidrug/hemolysin transport system ATP-binding protein
MTSVKVENLTKNFGETKAIDDLSFEVKKGSFFAFLGQNGAGKSTTINVLLGILTSDMGKITYEDNVNFKDFRKKIGVVFQNNVFDPLLTVKENLELYTNLSLDKEINPKKRILELQELFKIDYINQKFQNLSGGQKRKAEVARAVIASPSLLFLDEPTTGLDPKTRTEVWEIIHNIRKELDMTVFLTTHYMEECENADNIVIISHGQKIATGSPAQLKKEFSKDYLKITPHSPAQLEENLKKWEDKSSANYKILGNSYKIYLNDPQLSIEFLAENRENIQFFEALRGNMDDVFLNAVGEELD